VLRYTGGLRPVPCFAQGSNQLEQWAAQHELEERQRLQAEQEARERYAQWQTAQREEADLRAREARAQAHLRAAQQAEAAARATQQRLARLEAEGIQAKRRAAVEQTIANLNAAFQQPASDDEIIEYPNVLHRDFWKSRWGTD
jgi:hypothetical protein